MLKRYRLRKAAQDGAPEVGCIELLLNVRYRGCWAFILAERTRDTMAPAEKKSEKDRRYCLAATAISSFSLPFPPVSWQHKPRPFLHYQAPGTTQTVREREEVRGDAHDERDDMEGDEAEEEDDEFGDSQDRSLGRNAQRVVSYTCTLKSVAANEAFYRKRGTSWGRKRQRHAIHGHGVSELCGTAALHQNLSEEGRMHDSGVHKSSIKWCAWSTITL